MNSKYSTHMILGIVTVFCGQQCRENSASWNLSIITVLLFIPLKSSQSYKSYPALGLCACAEDVFDVISALF